MSRRLLLIPVLSTLLCIANAQETDKIIQEQKQLIGELSGEVQLADGSKLTARSRKEERTRARKLLMEKMSSLGLGPQEHSYWMRNLNPLIDLLFSPYKGANVYCILPSTIKSDEYVILGAHFDSELECPGAIDNGSGVAMMMTLLRKLSSLEFRNRNVIVVLFDQEEENLVGSRAFANFILDQGYKVHSVHTVDTIGWDADGDRAIEMELPSEELRTIYRKVALRNNQILYETRVNSTDHHSFRQLGFDAIGLTDELVNKDYAPYKDTPQDTFDTVNFEFLAHATLFVFDVMKEILENEVAD